MEVHVLARLLQSARTNDVARQVVQILRDGSTSISWEKWEWQDAVTDICKEIATLFKAMQDHPQGAKHFLDLLEISSVEHLSELRVDDDAFSRALEMDNTNLQHLIEFLIACAEAGSVVSREPTRSAREAARLLDLFAIYFQAAEGSKTA
jgi:hypothetical protein